uniref:Microcephalin n=1 Tax=Lygus hesperus TaxID=30085 RepID=A0A0A9Z9T4_LYGHE
MAPSSKRVKIAVEPPVVSPSSSTPASKSSKTRRNPPGRSTVSKGRNARKSKTPPVASEQKTPARSIDDEDNIFDLFCDPKSTKKSNTSKRSARKASPKTPRNCTPVDLDELLKDDEPGTPQNGKKNYIDGVFDKWMEIDPYASIARYLPGETPKSPDRPLTLFSPVKDEMKTCSAPQLRRKIRRALGLPCGENMDEADGNRTNGWGLPALSDARKEMQLGATPLFRKCLDPSAYSPCQSSGQTVSRLNGSAWSWDNESLTHTPDLPSCSTPLPFKTPSAPVNRSLTFNGEPLSGVKALFRDKGLNGAADSSNATTPVLPGRLSTDTPARPGINSFNVCNKDNNTPGGAKSTCLFGITCYVEVRYNKEDRSEWVRNEVASHGAKVEKNFTKKVTHVIFKEGKISTYMKAKELNIPTVSLLWIEACKTVGGLVDPKLYAPSDDEKYQKNMPIEEARKRERFLRRGQAFLDRLNGLLPPKPPRTRSNKKKAISATEGKKRKVANAEPKQPAKRAKPSKGPKKLDFNNPGPSRSANNKCAESDSDYVSETDTEENAPKDQTRRKSAPADLGEGGQQKLTRFFTKKTKETKLNDQDLLRTPPKSTDQDPQKDLLKILTGGYVTTDKKRRKLFDPNESMSFSQVLPGTPAEMSPYIKASPPSKSTRSRTTSSKTSKRVREAKRPLAARKSLAPLMEHEEQGSSLNQNSSRNSLSCFVLEKKSKVPAKCQPRIAFTSTSKDEMSRYKGIIAKLGMFEVDTTVTKRTTHLLTTAPPRRTVNLLKAIARGCWILDLEWLFYSESNGKWMSEEPFEMKSFSEAVTACRLEKQAFGKDFSLDLFSSYGSVFIDSDVQPPRADLAELLKLCGGKVVHVSTNADVVISRRPASESCSEVPIVSPLWILDSITQNKPLPINQYKI